MSSTNRPRVFLDVNVGEEPAGRLTIELFADKAPRTCENFRQLCTGQHNGLSYAKAPFHRVIDEFMIQGGDIAKGDGTGVVSIYGQEFEDENMSWRKMDSAGLLCSANRGKDTNGSQFFITLEPCEHLNGKHTIFGHIVSGDDTLQRIAKVAVDKSDRPLDPVLISRCGELEKRQKMKTAPPAENTTQPSSRDRGRKPRSRDSDVEMENSPEPRKAPKPRRQSDNFVDEGIRGRPRQRSGSGSRSKSRPSSTHEESESSERGSPARRHKRKRSPSPSRRGDKPDQERRRRSLPNQYDADRSSKTDVDGDDGRHRANQRRPDHHRDRQRRYDHDPGRRNDRYQPSRDRNPHSDDGRLGGGGGYDENDPPVKFKGRGVMKYREHDRY